MATQALSTQTSTTAQSIGSVSQWWPIEASLNCTAVRPDLQAGCLNGAASAKPDANLTKSLAQISDVLNKHKQALDTLNQAYAVFADFSKYNAGSEASSALAKSFTDTKSFLSAVQVLPAGAAASAAMAAAEKFAGATVSLVADDQENKQLLAASKDLHAENDALYAGLELERDAIVNLMGALQTEKIALYKSALTAGLVAPIDVLTPVFAGPYPDIQLNASAANSAVLMAAAQASLTEQFDAADATVAKTYDGALATLHAVTAEHQKFEVGQPVSLTMVEAAVNNLDANITAMNITSSTKSTSK